MKLFVDKTIELNAPIEKVWDVLTKKEYTDHWTKGFSDDIRVESDWNLGSPVEWKNNEGKVVVEGNVTAVEKNKFLRYTVFDVQIGKFPVTEKDGITFELSETNGNTTLHILHGDFSTTPDGKKYYDMTLPAWDRILPKIKELAEKN